MLKRWGSGRRQPIATARKLFHGVTISPAQGRACAAVTAVAGMRFLSEDAPLLPLSDCTNPGGCRCIYKHYEDRRSEVRRESDMGLPPKRHEPDVRAGAGRRVTDH